VTVTIAGEEIHLRTTLVSFLTGIAGGFAAKAMGFPLPMLLGSVVAVGAISIFGFKVGGHPPRIPFWLRLFFIPIIGLSIGASFTPDIFEQARSWWPSLLALVIYIPLAHFVGYQGFRRIGKLSGTTAYYAAVPGGLMESIAMGEENGADVQVLTALQFMRLILTVMLVPLAFTILSGDAVGSAAGAVIGGSRGVLDAPELFWQAIVGLIGYFGGRRLRLPAFVITGPVLASGLAHLSGLLTAAPPGWLIQVTQLIIGVALGTRFVGMRPKTFGRALLLAFQNMVFTMCLAMLFAVVLHEIVDEDINAVVLSFAPGGLAEMSLVALSLHVSVLFVTAHHVLRIVLSVTVAKTFAHRVPPDR